ncbi:hypothetical protein GCM10007425_06640 [Lysinibacillus alkalisoli]|uniref:Transglycosylase SLT domain-containing protein n=2 Tax=Lysinibacillus alkalisoli TaxID=1911548 RepID=A0A917FZA6_9BACI|nr:lytic transglycosylase domain-containing protein [Lysinibacillus alkalisoli]GGG15031.1 hypothetical protein GCM10007425_06640 [Lysinibacillus alkalisoli]
MKKLNIIIIIIMIPIAIIVYTFLFSLFRTIQEAIHTEPTEVIEEEVSPFDIPVPSEYLPIYMAAGKKYNIPWPLLAAHHRIETRFSTMETLVSPAGAQGHMQFMPCTFVGWKHPSCEGLGEGDISKEELTSVSAIAQYGGYGVDANGDGIADPYHIEDAIYSAANYLSRFGAADGEIERAIHEYNKSEAYVKDVLHFYELYTTHKDQLLAQIKKPAAQAKEE